MKNSFAPLPNGSFSVVPVNTLIRLALGNGTGLDVIVTPTDRGLCFSVLSCGSHGGSYVFNFVPSYSYVGDKLRLLDGDAICFVKFIAAQLDGKPVSRVSPAEEMMNKIVTRCDLHASLAPSSILGNVAAIRDLANDAANLLARASL